MSTVQQDVNNMAEDIELLDIDGLFDETADAGASQKGDGSQGLQLFRDVPLTVTLEIASTEITLGELSQAQAGDVLPLDKAVGEPLDVKVNGVLFAKAEVVMLNGRYGLKFVSSVQGAAVQEQHG